MAEDKKSAETTKKSSNKMIMLVVAAVVVLVVCVVAVAGAVMLLGDKASDEGTSIPDDYEVYMGNKVKFGYPEGYTVSNFIFTYILPSDQNIFSGDLDSVMFFMDVNDQGLFEDDAEMEEALGMLKDGECSDLDEDFMSGFNTEQESAELKESKAVTINEFKGCRLDIESSDPVEGQPANTVAYLLTKDDLVYMFVISYNEKNDVFKDYEKIVKTFTYDESAEPESTEFDFGDFDFGDIDLESEL